MSLFKDHMLGKEEAQSFAELSVCAFSTHLNLIATGTTTGNGEHHINLWDYEMCSLVGTCIHPNAKSGESFDVSALEFMSPKPYLVGSLSTGLVQIWEVPKAVCAVSLLPTCVQPEGSIGEGGSWVDDNFFHENKPTGIVTSLCLCEVEEGGDHIIFASDDKGFVYAWVVTEDIVAEGPISSKRRATFNPHRIVNTVVGGDELTHYRRISRSCQPRRIKMRTPSYFWRAHEEMISKISLVNNPSGVVTASHDFMAKIWDLDGNLLGKLDYNEPGVDPAIQTKKPWKFKPEVRKTIQHKHHEEDFHEMLMHEPIPEVKRNTMPGRVASTKVLHRHPSQENFLNKEFHHLEKKVVRGSVRGKSSDRNLLKNPSLKKVRRVTSWTRDQAKELINEERAKRTLMRNSMRKGEAGVVKEKEELGEKLAGSNIADKHWDGMMESLQVFETALVQHTKSRVSLPNDNWVQRQNKILFDPRPAEGKHWKIAPRNKDFHKTQARRPVDRPQTSPSKMMRKGKMVEFPSQILSKLRPNTGFGGSREGGRGAGVRTPSRESDVGIMGRTIKDDDKGSVTVAIKLKHMGFN